MGDGLAFVATTNLLSNTGVLSLQGDPGALSLSAGSGIGISGLTISNTGVLSLQGDTGALSLTADNGISISGLGIGMSGSYSGNFTGTGIGTFSTINVNPNSIAGGTGGEEIIAIYGGLQSFPTTSTNGGMYGIGMSGYTLQLYAADNFNFWQLGMSISTPAFSIGGADNASGTQFLVKTANNTLDNGSGDMVIAGDATIGGLTQISNGLQDETVDTPAFSEQAQFHNLTINDITGARWNMHNGNYRWNLAQETSTAGTFQDILSIDTGSGKGVGSNVYFRALDTSLPLNFVSFPSYSFDNELSISGEISASSYNLTGGTGISFSGTTITNTGVVSLQGDTGALSLTANNGISISGLGIGMSGSYSGNFSVNGSISTGAMPSFSNGIRETGYGSLRVGGNFAGIEMWQGSGHDIVRAFNAENYNAWSVGFFNESSGAFDGINSGDYSIAFAVYPNGEVVTGNAQSQGVNSNNFISVRNTLDDGSGNMSIAGYLIAHPTMGSNVVSGTLWNLSPTSSNVTFGSSNTGTVTLYIETIRATTTGKYYVQTHNTTANNYPDFWATYLEANVTYYVGQTFVIEIPGGDTITNWYAGGNAGGTLVVTGILNLG